VAEKIVAHKKNKRARSRWIFITDKMGWLDRGIRHLGTIGKYVHSLERIGD
jgi:hypothetical protein